MMESMCRGIDNAKRLTTYRLERDKKWYYIPPYRTSDGEKVVDSAGQLVGTFESKDLALECVETHNQNID